MKAKEYLNQARHLDTQINAKLNQIEALNFLATKCTSTITDMPKNSLRGTSRMEDAILKILDLKEEINNDINSLVDLKKEIMLVIKKVDNSEYKTLLENRYLAFLSWEVISVQMRFSIQQIYRIHVKALEEVDKIIKDKDKKD